MVKISRITIMGFKSFGRKKVQIRLPPGLVVVTGPNGGGKSTIVDGVRFALGELSAHNLRASRLSGLLHDSPAEKTQTAYVSLALENKGRELPIDSDEVVLTRRLSVSGESEYLINGRQVSRNEMLTILSAANIASDGLNIVTQGSVVSVAEMDGGELRQVLENVAGISAYKKRREEAQKELQVAEKNLEVANAATSEVRNRLRQLALERNQYLRKSLLESSVGMLRTASITKEIAALRHSLAEIDERLTQLAEKIAENREARENIVRSMDELRVKAEALSALETEKAGEYARVQETSQVDRAEATRIAAEINNLESNIQLTERQRKSLADRIGEINQRLSRLHELAGRHGETLESLGAELYEAERELAEKTAGLDDLKSLSERYEETLAELMRELAYLNVSEDGRLLLKERIEQQYRDAEKEEENLKRMLGELDGLIGETRNDIGRLTSELRSLEDGIGAQKDMVGKIRARMNALDAKVDDAVRRLAEVRALKANVDILRESTPRDVGNHQTPMGLVTLRDSLGKVDEVTSALLSDWLNAIIVKDVGEGVRLAVRAAAERMPIKVIAADTVDLMQPIRRGDVISTRLYGDVKLVQLKDLVGGLRNVATEEGIYVDRYGRIVVHGSEEGVGGALTKYSERLAGLEHTLNGLVDRMRARQAELKNGLDEAEKSLAEKLEKHMNLTEKLQKLSTSLEAMLSKRADLIARLEKVKNVMSEAGAQLEKLSLDIGMLHPKLSEFERVRTELKELRAAVHERGREVAEAGKRKDEILRRIREVEGGREGLLRQKEALKIQLDSYAADMRECEVRVGEYEKRVTELREKLKAVESKIDEVMSRLRTLANELQNIRSERQKILEEIRVAEKSLTELNETISRFEKEEQALRIERVRLETALAAMNDRLSIMGLNPDAQLDGGLPQEFLKLLEEELTEIPVVNQLAPSQYEAVIPNYKVRAARIYELELERQHILDLIRSIDEEEARVFNRTMTAVSDAFGYFFSQLTGGEGYLTLENPQEPSKSGVEMVVRFPGKQARSTSAVSGGEKSVAAISLILALQGITPAQFYIFDEVDAHLDINHTTKLVSLLKKMSEDRQIIVVTLKDVVAEKADALFGVYMVNGVSNVVRTSLEEVMASG